MNKIVHVVKKLLKYHNISLLCAQWRMTKQERGSGKKGTDKGAIKKGRQHRRGGKGKEGTDEKLLKYHNISLLCAQCRMTKQERSEKKGTDKGTIKKGGQHRTGEKERKGRMRERIG